MDHYSYLIDRQHRFLLIGILCLVMAALFTLTGTAPERFGRLVYRSEEPKRFWSDVAMFYLAGAFFIALFLYGA